MLRAKNASELVGYSIIGRNLFARPLVFPSRQLPEEHGNLKAASPDRDDHEGCEIQVRGQPAPRLRCAGFGAGVVAGRSPPFLFRMITWH